MAQPTPTSIFTEAGFIDFVFKIPTNVNPYLAVADLFKGVQEVSQLREWRNAPHTR